MRVSSKPGDATGQPAAPPYLDDKECTALNQLQKHQDIIIQPADKGSAIVILDTTDNQHNVWHQLRDEQCYQALDSDPTQKYNA